MDRSEFALATRAAQRDGAQADARSERSFLAAPVTAPSAGAEASAALPVGGPAAAPVLATQCDGVLTLTLARPPVNALDDALVDALDAWIARAGSDARIAVLHLRSAQKAFCAGADLALMQASIASPEGLEQMLALVRRMQHLAARLEQAPCVTLAEIGGAALGGGFELALGCDLRIAANEAVLGLPEAGLGLLPGAGGTQRLTRLVGPGLARRLILGAETLDGAAAQALGLVQWAVPRAELATAAHLLAGRIAALPRPALAAAKQCIAAALDGAQDGYAEEIAHTRHLYRNPETRERVAAFLARSARRTPATEETPR